MPQHVYRWKTLATGLQHYRERPKQSSTLYGLSHHALTTRNGQAGSLSHPSVPRACVPYRRRHKYTSTWYPHPVCPFPHMLHVRGLPDARPNTPPVSCSGSHGRGFGGALGGALSPTHGPAAGDAVRTGPRGVAGRCASPHGTLFAGPWASVRRGRAL